AAPMARAWRSPDRWMSTGCAGRSVAAAIRYRTDRPHPRSRGAVRGCTQVACPLSSEAERPSAHIMRLLSHPLDTGCVPGGGSVPCAPAFSYLDSASAEMVATGGRSGIPSDLTGALPSLAFRHEGFFVARHLAYNSRTPHELRKNP